MAGSRFKVLVFENGSKEKRSKEKHGIVPYVTAEMVRSTRTGIESEYETRIEAFDKDL